ncbi:MAG: cytochrome P450 [Rhizobiaceae bacterium]|nr:cytochrome P450 [Rhizobiaceae bacterium]
MKPPGPKGSLFWGSLKDFQADPLDFLLNASREHGHLARFRFAHLEAYLVNDPELIEEVLLRNSEHFDKDTRSAQKIRATCGDSLLSANQRTWQRHRNLIQPVFQPGFVATMDGVIDQTTEEMLSRWENISKSGDRIDLVAEITALVIDISTKVLFASDIDPGKLETALAIVLDDTWRRLQSPIDLSEISTLFHRKSFKSSLSEIDEIVFGIIKGRRSSRTGHNDVLSRLFEARTENSDKQLSNKELRDAVITLLLAGHETTANALSWAFYLLAREPKKIPIDGNFENVFRETLRLYPSIWIIERRIKERTQIGDHMLKKGASVLISPYVLHRNVKFWEQPEDFNPDRFLETENETRPRNAYLPFGLGKHRCVGLHMATRIATRVLSVVHEKFKLTVASTEKPIPYPGITLRHSNNIYCYVEDV